MANPKYRISKARKGRRRAHHALSLRTHSVCTNCGTAKLAHSICEACGFHRGKQVMAPRQAALSMNSEFSTDS